MFHLDFGHNPRAGSVSAPDRAALSAAENAWFDYYLKGVGPEPADARGGVDVLTSKCPVSGAGTHYHAPSWGGSHDWKVGVDFSHIPFADDSQVNLNGTYQFGADQPFKILGKRNMKNAPPANASGTASIISPASARSL